MEFIFRSCGIKFSGLAQFFFESGSVSKNEMPFSTEFLAAGASTALFGLILIRATKILGCAAKASYVLSTVHAIAMMLLTGYTIFVECWDTYDHHCHFDSESNSAFQQITLLFSLGYFVIDSVVVLWFSPDVSASLHHTSIIAGQIAAISSGLPADPSSDFLFQTSGSSGYALACFLFAAELSAPLLNAFLSGLTKEGTQVDFITRASFAFVFIVSRLVVCPFLTYEFVVNSPRAHIVPKLVCLFVMGISVYWSKSIFAAILEAIRGPSNQSKKMEDDDNVAVSARVKGE